ncbi:MAG: phosphoribosylaminoimidazolesuccinocarboxamide synthase [Candidatus Andersenbacteria bacterium]
MTVTPRFLTDNDGASQGKVRNIYNFGDRLLLVTTDRISAYDRVLPTEIPDKGRMLTGLSQFWFQRLPDQYNHHLITTDLAEMAKIDPRLDFGHQVEQYQGRCMLVRKTNVVPIECVVRGYLAGSGWKEYRKSETICGITLPPGLQESEKLPAPIFTPATKEKSGHDINISFEEMCKRINNPSLAGKLRSRSLSIYRSGAKYAAERGILIADTKFEWGLIDGKIILIDEVLTPDSSRFWPADQYRPGQGQPSYDKQYVRDWLDQSGWDRESEPPTLPPDVIEQTRQKYIAAYEKLTGSVFPY